MTMKERDAIRKAAQALAEILDFAESYGQHVDPSHREAFLGLVDLLPAKERKAVVGE